MTSNSAIRRVRAKARRPGTTVAAVIALSLFLGACGSPPAPTPVGSVGSSQGPSASATPAASADREPSPTPAVAASPLPGSPAPSATPSLEPDAGDTQPAGRWPPSGIQVYAGAVSVLAGQSIPFMVSTRAATYSISLARVTAKGELQVFSRTGLNGHDQFSLVRIDPVSHAVRAHWSASVEVPTDGWTPGIYILTAMDSGRTSSHAVVVVRTPTLDASKPVFVYDALTQAAYNDWGGWSFYHPRHPLVATQVTFDRPLVNGGLGVWAKFDSRLVPWLLARRPDLQFTTDYDLALDPPTTAPRALIFGFHTEYVPAPLRDWVRLHVDTVGDMNLAIFGANSFYWRVRLVASATPGLPAEMVCYKLDPAADPLHATSPTGRYRDLGEPEGAFIGSQYTGVVFNGGRRVDTTITADMPPDLLAGTGWQAGTVLRGLVYGEADAAFPVVGSTTVATSTGVRNPYGGPIQVGMVIRTTAAGAHVFDAGTFAFSDGLTPARVALGVPARTFDRFVGNILGWLGVPALR